MCGIFGLTVHPHSTLGAGTLRSTVARLFRLAESRGKEAAGLAIRADNRIFVHRDSLTPSQFIRSQSYRELLDAALPVAISQNGGRLPHPLAILGHARLATNGAEAINSNNQPVVKRGVVGVHNGIIVNVDELWRTNPDLSRQCHVDTEVLLDLVRKSLKKVASPVEAIQSAFRAIEGSASVGLLFEDLNCLALATNTGSLYTCQAPDGQAFVFVSERLMLEQLMRRRPWRDVLRGAVIRQLTSGHGLIVSLDDLRADEFALDRPSTAVAVPLVGASPVAAVLDSMEQAERARESLRRCTRCILPETMPFIEFDEQGVCNYCRNYEKIEYLGEPALRAAVAPHRGRGAEPDCVVAFSGGRDSSYSLHYMAAELGMKPVAFTYDWGMVNGLARRNQARIIGKLGIEHIIIAADIRKKRRFIRRNIEAWLKRPDLGVIPLFMAGDKQFFYHANQLRRQTGVDLSVWAFNRLEMTCFKTGFCGIRGKYIRGTHWELSSADRARLAGYYAWQFLRNPAYLNASLWDTLFAYVSFYVLKHDYFWFFDFIPWDERLIDRTLHEEYDWETASDTGTTWRIGDGTAAFYNYIYHTVAGFTENDTFRSNQIREGIMTRAEALAQIGRDNVPRYESIREYAQIVGIDFGEVIRVVNAMPKRYAVDVVPRGVPTTAAAAQDAPSSRAA
jgi:glutamine---fructose-6-phosphate transaminase (isomerizing)